MSDENIEEYDGTSSPVCPYCDYEYMPEDVAESDLYEEGNHQTIPCTKCGKDFFVSVKILFLYSTEKIS